MAPASMSHDALDGERVSTSRDARVSLRGDSGERVAAFIIEVRVRRGICSLRRSPQALSFNLSTHTPEAPVRARIILTGLIAIGAAACSRPAADPVVDPATDEPSAARDLALTSPSDAVPVASDLEVHRPEPTPLPESRLPTPDPANIPEPVPEPIGIAVDGTEGLTPEPMPVATSHVHPDIANPEETVTGPSVEGGGKPTGISTGLGPVPDRNWGDPAIMDDPTPIPVGIGGVIIRGGAGGMDDDCKIHPRGGVVAGGGMGTGGPGALVNDRDPRRGALINERAPRTSSRPSLPRGSGFPRGGIR
jgi:hypothetical protein